MAEFTVAGIPYRTPHKLNARQQFHIARRLGPVITQVGQQLPLIQAAIAGQVAQVESANSDGEAGDVMNAARRLAQQIAMFEELGRPILEALAKLTDADCNYVFDLCLSAVQRLAGGNGAGGTWTDIWNVRAGRLMFEDIELGEMMQITMEVLRENLLSFFSVRSQAPVVTGQATSPTLNG